MSATQAATPSTMPPRRRVERFREDPVPSSIHRSPSSTRCWACCTDVPSSIEAPPLSVESRLRRLTRLTHEGSGPIVPKVRTRVQVGIRIRKFVMGSLTRERSTSPARRSPARPADSSRTRAVDLDLDESSPKRLSSTLASSSTSPSLVPEASWSTRRKSGTAQQASARAARWTVGSAERQRRPRWVSSTWPDRPATSPKSLALANRLRNAPLRTRCRKAPRRGSPRRFNRPRGQRSARGPAKPRGHR